MQSAARCPPPRPVCPRYAAGAAQLEKLIHFNINLPPEKDGLKSYTPFTSIFPSSFLNSLHYNVILNFFNENSASHAS